MAQKFKISIDPIYCRKLRPLTPRPFTSISNISIPFCTINPTPYSTGNPINNLAWNQYLSGVSEYGARREISRVPLVSSRWKPTAEQLQALEEMYRCGTKTPSAQQIQQIAAKLRRFGEIEGKNVFYWFQNHKARERQKKRRQMESTTGKSTSNDEASESGVSSRIYLRTEHLNKKRPTPSNCTTPSEYSVATVVEQCRWTHNITAEKAAGQENEKPFSSLHLSRLLSSKDDDFRVLDSGIKENRTLQLFPVTSNDLSRTHS